MAFYTGEGLEWLTGGPRGPHGSVTEGHGGLPAAFLAVGEVFR